MKHKRIIPRRNTSIGVLVSGGLDSNVLVAELAQRRRKVFPLYVRQGLRWERVELYWLRRYLKALTNPRIEPLHILDLPMNDVYGKHWSLGRQAVPGLDSPDRAVYLPGRNVTLLAKAAVFCALRRVPAIALGSLGHNPFPDARPQFFKGWAKALAQGLNSRIAVLAPYRRLSKAVVIRRGQKWPLALSFSCLSPVGRRHCGRCNKCAERQKAFRAAGVKDLTNYAGN